MTSPMPAYVINLDKRPDRLKTFQNDCARYNFGPVTRVTAHQTSKAPDGWSVTASRYGCIHSHRTIWSKITKPTVIFEDDAQLVRPFSLPPLPPGFDIFYLGGNDSHFTAQPGPVYMHHQVDNTFVAIHKCKRLFAAHAYIISPAGAQAALKIDLRDRPVDIGMCELQRDGRCYYMRPSLFIQRAGYSNIEHKQVDYSQFT